MEKRCNVRDWLGVERNLNTKLLSHTVEEVAGHPKLVTHGNTLARTNLVLPLGRKHFSVDTRDVDVGVQAGLVVGLYDVTAVDLAGTDTTVVWALRAWETSLWPSVWGSQIIEEGILLLKTEPRDLALVGLHKLSTGVPVVELVWGTIVVPALGEDEDVLSTTEWVGVDGDWSKVDIGVLTRGLAGGGTVKVPFWEIVDRLGSLVKGLKWRNVSNEIFSKRSM